MNIPQILEKEFLSEVPKEKLDEVHFLESEELLSNLGYISNNKNVKTGPVVMKRAVAKFRKELQISKDELKELIKIPETGVADSLIEEEIDILNQFSSLEGEFKLHKFPIGSIAKNPILSRILNFRMFILSLTKKEACPELNPETEKILNKLGKWCKINGNAEIIRLTGDVEELSQIISSPLEFEDSLYKHVVFFFNKLDTKIEKQFRRNDDIEHFVNRHKYSKNIEKSFKITIRNKKKIKAQISDELNKLITRLVQIRLYLLGTYGGKLDSVLGSMSLLAISNLLNYHQILTNNYNLKTSDFLIYLRDGLWALNATFLIRQVLPLLTEKQEENTVAEGVGKILNKAGKSKREELVKTIHQYIINEEKLEPANTVITSHRKTKTKAGKGLLRSISRFFKRVGSWLKTAFDKALEAIKNLFEWIKNAAILLVNELKKLFRFLKQAITFFFNGRKISTYLNGETVLTDYQSNYDGITYITSTNNELMLKHVENQGKLALALNESAGFLGTVVSIAIKIGKGPFGWLQLGILLLREISGNKIKIINLRMNQLHTL